MDALCIYKNGIRQLAVELIPSAGVEFSLNWFGNAKNGIAITVSRANELAEHSRWNALQVLAGDTVSFVTRAVDTADEPTEFFTDKDLVNVARSKPKMRSGKRVKPQLQEIGVLECHINDRLLFSFHLNTDNMLSVAFVWLGDRTGTSVMYIGSEVSPKPIIPMIAFGDEVTVIWR